MQAMPTRQSARLALVRLWSPGLAVAVRPRIPAPMPQRPRSHQLEDLSFNRFRAALPVAWAVRERSRDYGLDLEVEIFTDAGVATGLFFYVQLRATDDPGRARKLRFKVDQLDYFRLLDLPTAIVRYAGAEDTFHMMWAFEAPEAGAGASQTLSFADDQRWTAETPALIVQTLDTLRKLNRRSDTAPLALTLVNEGHDPERSYAAQTAFESLRKLGFVSDAHDNSTVAMEIHCTDKRMTLRVDRFAEVEVEKSVAGDLTAGLVWSAVRLLWRLGLKPAANRLARRAEVEGHAPPTRSLALSGALALLPDTAAAVDFACSAGLQDNQDEALLVLIVAIHKDGVLSADRDSHLVLLRQALDTEAVRKNPTAQSSLTYSIGNALRASGRYAAAVMHYRKALRLLPAYADSSYFWQELGGCFYMRRKFYAASKAYERARCLEPGPHVSLLEADALLGAGEIGRAAELYDLASRRMSPRTPGEAQLKAQLCRRLSNAYGARFARPTRLLAPLWTRAQVDGDWESVLLADPLDPLANFNSGKTLADAKRVEDAFWRYLAVVHIQPGDLEAWSNAIGCALTSDVVRLNAVLHLALFHCGRAPYDILRSKLAEQEGRVLIPDLDRIVKDILALAEPGENTLAIRLFDGREFRPVLSLPS